MSIGGVSFETHKHIHPNCIGKYQYHNTDLGYVTTVTFFILYDIETNLIENIS